MIRLNELDLVRDLPVVEHTCLATSEDFTGAMHLVVDMIARSLSSR